MSKKKAPAYKSPGKAIDPGLPSIPDKSWDDEEKLYGIQSNLANRVYGDVSNVYQGIQDRKGPEYERIWNPIKTQIDDTYDKLYGGTRGQAGNLGMLDSVGFADYVTKNIANEKAKTLAQAQADLPSMVLQPYMQTGQFADTGMSSLQDRINSAYANEFNRAQMLNNYKLNKASQINNYNLGSYQAEANDPRNKPKWTLGSWIF